MSDPSSSPRRLAVGAIRGVLETLLLKPQELLDPAWVPDTSIADFIRQRLRSAAYFLQRAICGEEGFDAGLFDMSEEEGEEIRWLIRLFQGTLRVVGRSRLKSCRVFEIALILTTQFPPTNAVEDLVHSIIHPVILSMLDVAKSTSRHCGGVTDYPEYDVTGNLAPFQGPYIFPSLIESRAASW
ncbi:hypothetical protein DFH09DRAFT_1318792 [Mycena vulgaris]|nr:hypothetical protein DFH09DRAFT_1318792 [Mycena vulgaris]